MKFFILVLSVLLSACGDQRNDVYSAVMNPEVGCEWLGPALQAKGLVAAVRPDEDGQQHVIMVTIGSEENIEVGDTLSIYRGEIVIVKVRVEKCFPDMSACLMDQATWNKHGLSVALCDLVYED